MGLNTVLPQLTYKALGEATSSPVSTDVIINIYGVGEDRRGKLRRKEGARRDDEVKLDQKADWVVLGRQGNQE